MVTLENWEEDPVAEGTTDISPTAFTDMTKQIKKNRYGYFHFNRYNAVNAMGTKPTLGTAGTNTKIGTMSFADAAVPIETFQPPRVPDEFKEDGDLVLEIDMYSETANNNVMFEYSIVGIADGEGVDPVHVFVPLDAITLPSSTATLKRTTITISGAAHGLARGDLLYFALKRNGTDGADNHAAAVRVTNCTIRYQLGEND